MQITETLTRTGTISQPEKQVKWRNAIYNKDGTNGYGKLLWDTQDQAEKGLKEMIDEMLAGKYNLRHTNGVVTTKDTYAWHMQLPVMQ